MGQTCRQGACSRRLDRGLDFHELSRWAFSAVFFEESPSPEFRECLIMDKDPPRHDRTGRPIDTDKLDRVVAEARRSMDERAAGYREQALKLFPWICGRCGREFTRTNLRELTVHHKDMDHDNNPADGSNWELLCLYCHDNEHQKYEEHMAARAAGKVQGTDATESTGTKHRPFADLEALLKKKDD